MAVNKGRMLNLNADFTEALQALGMINGMAAEIRTSEYTSSIISMAHARLSQLFDWHVDQVAAGTTVRSSTTGREYSPLHHVYEWGKIGEPGARLWKHVLYGVGANRTASFEFRASNMPVPHPYHNSGRSHVFHWKAPIMEYSMPVQVRPKFAKRLAWFQGGQWNFSSGVKIDNPGGETRGQFTNTWVYWWNGTAPIEFQRVVSQPVEKDLEESAKEVLRRKRKKNVSLSTISDADKAFELGEKMARARVRKDAESYSNVSKEILRGLSD